MAPALEFKERQERIIIGTQLQKARELLLLTAAEVAQELNVTKQDILNWEKELSNPDLKQLEKLAKLYGREINYFLRETPPLPKKIEFRGKPGQSLSSLPKEAKVALAKFDELCRTALELEHLLEKKRTIKLPRFDESTPAQTFASRLREALEANNKPIPNLRDCLEERGVRVFELAIPKDAFSGFSFWLPEYGPCILLNTNEPKGRKNFTLAHELAHVLYNHGSTLCYISLESDKAHRNIEYKANQCAIQLLLPVPGVREDFQRRNLPRTPPQEKLGQMADKWGVSIQALGYRLENIGFVNKGHTDTLFEHRPPFFRRSKTPKWEKQLGKEFVRTTLAAYQKGLISTGTVAHSLGITIREALTKIEQQSKQQT